MTILDIDPLNIAQCVCRRPKMWTSTGSLAEVLAFFAGYQIATQHVGRLDDNSPTEVLRWLAADLEITSMRPEDQLTTVVDHYKTEEAALRAIDSYASTLPTK